MSDRILPARIRLEATSHCQLKCPSCPTADGSIHPAIGGGFLKPADFERLLRENPWIKEVELSNYGEMFLNPHLLDILKLAHERGILLTACNGVNLNTVRDEVLEGLVQYGLREMTCSIDGASNETYAVYRVRGHFDAVIANIRRINEYKAKHRSRYPVLAWQFVVFGHNEHELPKARDMARELDMAFVPKLTWDPKFSPIRDEAFVARELGSDVVSRAAYLEKHGRDYMQGMCHQLWDSPQVNWDGKLLGCCRNFWGDFGPNAFTHGLEQVLNGEKIGYAREMLTGKQPARDDIPCTTCDIYLGMRGRSRWLVRPRPGLRTRLKRFLKRMMHLGEGPTDAAPKRL